MKLEEGDRRTITQVCKRRTCEICGELATHQLTFLLPKARSNPASSGYGKDDIRWCSDAKMFVCEKHERERWDLAKERKMEYCSSFMFGDRFKHLFLHWITIDENNTPKPKED